MATSERGNTGAWQHRSQHTSDRLTYMVKLVLTSRQDTQSTTQVYTQLCTVITGFKLTYEQLYSKVQS